MPGGDEKKQQEYVEGELITPLRFVTDIHRSFDRINIKIDNVDEKQQKEFSDAFITFVNCLEHNSIDLGTRYKLIMKIICLYIETDNVKRQSLVKYLNKLNELGAKQLGEFNKCINNLLSNPTDSEQGTNSMLDSKETDLVKALMNQKVILSIHTIFSNYQQGFGDPKYSTFVSIANVVPEEGIHSLHFDDAKAQIELSKKDILSNMPELGRTLTIEKKLDQLKLENNGYLIKGFTSTKYGSSTKTLTNIRYNHSYTGDFREPLDHIGAGETTYFDEDNQKIINVEELLAGHTLEDQINPIHKYLEQSSPISTQDNDNSNSVSSLKSTVKTTVGLGMMALGAAAVVGGLVMTAAVFAVATGAVAVTGPVLGVATTIMAGVGITAAALMGITFGLALATTAVAGVVVSAGTSLVLSGTKPKTDSILSKLASPFKFFGCGKTGDGENNVTLPRPKGSV